MTNNLSISPLRTAISAQIAFLLTHADLKYAFIFFIAFDMPLNSAVRQCVAENLSLFEGKTDHLYLDNQGYPTIGIGHCIANLDVFLQLPMVRIADGQTATKQQKIAEYQNIKQKPQGYKADWYAAFCQLRLPEAAINQIHQQQLNKFHQELRHVFQRSRGYSCDFEQLPSPVQIALFDLVYNVGSTNLQHKWPKLHQAIKQQDWHEAAKQSSRKGIQAARNEHIQSLFLSAGGHTSPKLFAKQTKKASRHRRHHSLLKKTLSYIVNKGLLVLLRKVFR
ncbi:hypothetical protein PULV_a2291 [Pseudoalteromonas ulvae UL12]|uniref:Lysozyme n=1 Tax=Pseudoalteromonas ulvae TaxID=107327 RepID=A0A2C9ZZT0_PSEDV|nr:pesticin C-terminus-like muramidase [Pseudoalteromonas ulvae]MBE0364573.1 hypothetical protein [Pseudoalteromonas ulvae UL12]OUL56274.1 hypothetical protein B1199_19390 [Pseudoalteromonas ulvae]